jgi:uncharacterized protein YecE (DUF72 family)
MLRIGTCSWKYDSWRGIVYTGFDSKNYLQEYSKKFNTVEIDQWFWSLFPPAKIVLPQKKIVEDYASSVPNDFLFTIKVPNSITLTHFYKKNKDDELIRNPFFLSNELFDEFLTSIKPLLKRVGCLIFQFEYLNKKKMKALSEFQTLFLKFYRKIDKNIPQIAIETRNPNYLNVKFFSFLSDLKIAPVLIEGYYMPSIVEVYKKFGNMINHSAVIRLIGPERQGIEKIANDNWNQIYINRDKELKSIVVMIKELQNKEVNLFVNVNNHLEGSAPMTIEKLKRLL